MDTKGGERSFKPYLECGKIVNTHGVRGGVKLECWADTPAELASLRVLYFREGGAYRPVRVLSSSVMKRHVVVTLEGIDDIDKAQALRDRTVFAARDDLPLDDGDYFIADLIGLPVIDADSGHVYGTVADVFNAGASDIYSVSTPDGERLIPAVDEFIVSIDTTKGVFIRPIGGMFD